MQTAKQIAKAEIREKLNTDQRWLERGILAIDARQTDDEQQEETTKYLNSRGWTHADAKRGSYMARWIRNSQAPEGERLTGNHVIRARRMTQKYVSQLWRITQGW